MGCKNICTTVEQPDEAPLLGGCLLGAVESELDVAAVRAHARVLDQLVHLRKQML